MPELVKHQRGLDEFFWELCARFQKRYHYHWGDSQGTYVAPNDQFCYGLREDA